MPFTDSDLANFGLAVLCAEDMHNNVNTVDEKAHPPIDPRLAPDWNVRALVTAKDALIPIKGVRLPLVISDDALFYGFLAESTSENGKWLLAFRGTAGLAEWIIDGQFFWKSHPRCPEAMVEQGFWDIYDSMKLTDPTGGPINDDAAAGIADLVGAAGTVTVAGHSLGSSLATYMTFDLADILKERVKGCFFASPRTGNDTWAAAFEERVSDYLVVNYVLDMVPHLPTRPGYATLGNVRILAPDNAQAAIRVDVGCNHHLICYCALLDYQSTMAFKLIDTDLPCRACIIGQANATSLEAKSMAFAITAVGDSENHVSALFRGMFALTN